MVVLIAHDVVVVQRLQIVFSQRRIIVVLEGRKRVLLFHQLCHRVLVDFPPRASRAASVCVRRAGASVGSPALPTARATHRPSLNSPGRHRLRAQRVVSVGIAAASYRVDRSPELDGVQRLPLWIIISPH